MRRIEHLARPGEVIPRVPVSMSTVQRSLLSVHSFTITVITAIVTTIVTTILATKMATKTATKMATKIASIRKSSKEWTQKLGGMRKSKEWTHGTFQGQCVQIAHWIDAISVPFMMVMVIIVIILFSFSPVSLVTSKFLAFSDVLSFARVSVQSVADLLPESVSRHPQRRVRVVHLVLQKVLHVVVILVFLSNFRGSISEAVSIHSFGSNPLIVSLTPI